MLGVLFLALALWTGFVLTKKNLPGLTAAEGFPSIMTALPAAFTIGVIASGMLTYAFCLLFAHTGRAMMYGTSLAAASMALFSALTLKKTFPDRTALRAGSLRDAAMKSFRSFPAHYCLILLLAVFVGWVFRHSFFYEDGSLFVGYSVFSDFGPHVAVIRSFSLGNNFPTQYPHFPDGSMMYHFMFMFYTGILEFLGLRIDHAFNGLSLLSLMCCLSLLYVLAVKITRKPTVGVLAIVLFLFRSSFAAFTFLFGGAGVGSVSEFFEKILGNAVFIGNTPNEVWGLWNINVYANQRHLGFGLSLIFLLILALLPLYEGMRFRGVAKHRAGEKGQTSEEEPAGEKGQTSEKGTASGKRPAGEKGQTINKGTASEKGPTIEKVLTSEKGTASGKRPASEKGQTINKGTTGEKRPTSEKRPNRGEIIKYLKNGGHVEDEGAGWLPAFFNAETWRPQNYARFAFLGLLTGGAAYFHGSCVVAALSILAVMAIFSKEKLGFVLMAGIALILTSLQNNYFSAGAPGIAPSFQFGFIAADKSVAGVARYLVELTGIVLPVALAGAALRWKKTGGLCLAFLVPAVLTFTLSLTPDITVNHKYLMISIALLNIFAAYAIVSLAESFKRWKSKALKGAGIAIAGALVLVLTVSGILDIVPFSRQTGEGSRAVYADSASDTVAWISDHTEPGSVFLSHWHVQSPVLLAGRFEYIGWPYFGWSAGYDTYGREDRIKSIFASGDSEELRDRALASGASYIFVDRDLIENHDFGFSEEIVASTFTMVFTSEPEGIRIYRIEG